jgi:hypothetical protein
LVALLVINGRRSEKTCVSAAEIDAAVRFHRSERRVRFRGARRRCRRVAWRVRWVRDANRTRLRWDPRRRRFGREIGDRHPAAGALERGAEYGTGIGRASAGRVSRAKSAEVAQKIAPKAQGWRGPQSGQRYRRRSTGLAAGARTPVLAPR